MLFLHEGKQRCFLAKFEDKPWNLVQNYCRSLNPGGGLAVDDSEETHQILNTLIPENKQFWLGGKTEPYYWNWAPTKGLHL